MDSWLASELRNTGRRASRDLTFIRWEKLAKHGLLNKTLDKPLRSNSGILPRETNLAISERIKVA